MLLLFMLLGDATKASIQAVAMHIPQYVLCPGAYHWNIQLAVESRVSKRNVHTFADSFLMNLKILRPKRGTGCGGQATNRPVQWARADRDGTEAPRYLQ